MGNEGGHATLYANLLIGVLNPVLYTPKSDRMPYLPKLNQLPCDQQPKTTLLGSLFNVMVDFGVPGKLRISCNDQCGNSICRRRKLWDVQGWEIY